ncbi:hypothetical protein [Arthrobacter bambusae]|uniref:hypothetical protein n=1 Tax=Arthrobacter bambusae TaxID=1338426 RepID=UPI0027876902|nr:hypothetical protein [Arthrobacter bambusae]MDQ0029029.1 hypothetical protein [Arthrobacter bambusae]MDQ0098569.1 hypothetical protein [Arthrobacter bambusae]
MPVSPNKLKRTSMAMVGAAVAAASLASVGLPASAAEEREEHAAGAGFTVTTFAPVGTESARASRPSARTRRSR